MSSDILNEFIFDSREHLSTAGAQLLALEKEPASLAALNALMGTLHTIKGNSGFVDLKNLYSLMHRSESLLQTVREVEGLSCPPTIIDQLFQVLDTAEAVLGRLENGDDDRVDWLDSLNQALSEAEQNLEQQASQTTEQIAALPENEKLSPMATASNNEAAASPASINLTEDVAGQIKIIRLDNDQLSAEGDHFLLLVEAMLAAGLSALILDLRSLDRFSSPDLTLLLTLHRKCHDSLALILDKEKNEALFRIFQILNLDRILHFFAEEESALAHFAAIAE